MNTQPDIRKAPPDMPEQPLVKQGRTGPIQPFDLSRIVRRGDGVLAYDRLPSSLVDMLARARDLRSGAKAAGAAEEVEAVVEVGGPRLSYAQFWDRAARVAGGLRDQGIGRGDRVAVRLLNGVDWCVAFFGTLMVGAAAVPLNTRFAEPEIEQVITDSEARFVIGPEPRLPDGPPYVSETIELDDLAAIFYTSGTTGVPKGALLSHRNCLANNENCRRMMLYSADEPIRNLVSVPLFHVTGCVSQFLVTLGVAGTTVIMPSFSVQGFLHAIEGERATAVPSVPAIFWLAMNQPNFADFDLTRVTRAFYGGASTPPDVIARIRESFPNARLGNGFGMTETASGAAFLPSEYTLSHIHTVGFPAPSVEVDLAAVRPDGVGELLIRGENVISGYWRREADTAAAFTGRWLHSGDLARVDPDGFVQIVDRKKDMINRGGENVYCLEVENAIGQHPAVFEVAVVGVPDVMMGEKVGAAVVLRDGFTLAGPELVEFLRDRIADFKIPQYLSVRSEPLPRNANGKVRKPALREESEWGSPVGA
jgi:long-chain acyl-CoA synthetase